MKDKVMRTKQRALPEWVKRIRIHKKLVILASIILIAAAAFCVTRIDFGNQGITAAEAAKLIAYAQYDAAEFAKEDYEGYWYEKYMRCMKENDYLRGKKPLQKLYYSDVRELVKKQGGNVKDISVRLTKIGVISKQDFLQVYMELLPLFAYGDKIQEIEAGIAGTPSNIDKTSAWTACTTKGNYAFTGLIMDDKIDKTVRLIVRDKEILTVKEIVSDSVVYRNIWIKTSSEGNLYTNIYGADRTFYVEKLSESVAQVLSDIEIREGKIRRIDIKTDTISGKVLSVTSDYVEIEKYGKVTLDEYFMIYDISTDFKVRTYSDIIVGYSLQDFVVAGGKICGAIISQSLTADNIRVLLKTTGHKDIFHEAVQLTSDQPFTVQCGDVTVHKEAGEVISYEKDNEDFKTGRVIIKPSEEGQIQLLSINRSHGNPQYEGRIELSLFDEGIAIVNDVNIETYLKRVVPSEMPASFGTEALKVQAVCARSYAYRQLTNNHYGRYGAHVDDSTQYQVYNNINEHENSNLAIAQTRGLVLQYNGEVVQTYYYSTSCGVGTDVSVWGTAAENYPYFVSRDISRTERNLDLTNEENFKNFITNVYNEDYDRQYALYRWNMQQTQQQISDSFNAKLAKQYRDTPARILTRQANGQFVSRSISDIGTIQDIIVNKRVKGGAAVSVTVIGTSATVKVESESCIRAMFGDEKAVLNTVSDTRNTENLPSAFCIFEKVYENGTLTGFRIVGGGYGHGIGMSQNAVKGMVDDGKKFDEILQFFYPGTSFMK